MKKKQQKAREKRSLAMTPKQRVFMAKVRHGLAKNQSVKDMKGACSQLGVALSNGRRALLDQSQGDTAKKIKADILNLAGIKPKTAKAQTTTEETSCQTN